MSTEMRGHELALRLFLGFRALVDDVHAELARQGHPDVRPVHGFALQAIGPGGSTATELGRRLGVTKQAAAKTVHALEQRGYVQRSDDPRDARRRLVSLTARGRDCLDRSGRIFDALRDDWRERMGRSSLAALESALRTVTPPDVLTALDVPGWFGDS